MRKALIGLLSTGLVLAIGFPREAPADAPGAPPCTGGGTSTRHPATQVRMLVDDDHALVYRNGQLIEAPGLLTASDVLLLQQSPARLWLCFERPVDTSRVTAALEGSLHDQARLTVTWPRADLAELHLAWDPLHPGDWHTIGFTDTRDRPAHDACGGRIDFSLPAVELHPSTRFHRWHPDDGTRAGAPVPPRLTLLAHDNVVDGHRVLMEHFEEEAGDYFLQTPVLVDTLTGDIHRLLADTGIESAQWLPNGRGIVLPWRGSLRLFDSRAAPVRSIELSPEAPVLGIAVDPRSGRIATALQHPALDAPLLPVRLDIHAADGTRLLSVPDFTDVERLELGFESPQPVWMQDGRLAFLDRRPGISATGAPRELAIFDPASGQTLRTRQPAGQILGVADGGVILLPSGHGEASPHLLVYDPASGASDAIGFPPGRSFRPEAISPDGAWIAAVEHTGDGPVLGALRLQDRTWHPIGRGALVGWDSDGGLVWMH